MKNKVFIIWLVVIGSIASAYLIYNYVFKKDADIVQKNVEQKVVEPTKDVYQIQEITGDLVGKQVKVKGKIIDTNTHKNGHVFLTVEDETGKILIPVFEGKDIDKNQFNDNDVYYVSGKVENYKGTMEIIPESQKDFQKVKSVESIENSIGKNIELEGNIVSTYQHPDGHVFLTVHREEDSKDITVPVFKNLEYDIKSLATGSRISVKGKVEKYKNKLEVVPSTKEDIKIISQGQEEEANLVSIADVNESMRGKMIQIRGTVKEMKEVNGHLYFNIVDKGQEIKAVLFRADGNEIEGRRTKLKEAEQTSSSIRMLGTVEVYKGELQIIVDKVYNKY